MEGNYFHFWMAWPQSVKYFFFFYQSPCSSLCTVFVTVWSNALKVLLTNVSTSDTVHIIGEKNEFLTIAWNWSVIFLKILWKYEDSIQGVSNYKNAISRWCTFHNNRRKVWYSFWQPKPFKSDEKCFFYLFYLFLFTRNLCFCLDLLVMYKNDLIRR